MASKAPELTIKNLFAGYGKREVLKDINLKVSKGETAAVVGQNGAGKSTLIKSIIGFLMPSKGSIVFRDMDITRNDIKTRVDEGIYYFMQGGQIFPSLTIKENLVLATHNLTSKIQEQRISELMPIVFPEKSSATKRTRNGKSPFLSQNASQLSGGEKHKLALLMVLLNYPRLLLLDEPSAGLSPQNASMIYKVIDDFVGRFQSTILLIEQNVKLAVENSDRIYLLKGGKIEHDTLSKLIRTINGEADSQKMDEFFFGKLI